MFSPVDPQTVLMIHKEKEAKLMREIESYRIAKERRAFKVGGSSKDTLAWYAQALQWMNANLFHRAPMPVPQLHNAQPEPCCETPC